MSIPQIGPVSGGINQLLLTLLMQYSGPDYVQPCTPSSQMQNVNLSFGTPQQLPLTSGLNTQTVPAGASGYFFRLPVTNTVPVTIKNGVSGDTGTHMAPNGFTVFPFDQNNMPAAIYITTASAIPSGAEWAWI